MTEQTQMVPLSKVETAEKSLGNARARLSAALELRDAAEANLLRARAEQDMEIPGEATEEGDVEVAEVLAIEGEVTDPITGEETAA